MADYRDPYERDTDPITRSAMRDPDRANSGVGWIAGAIFLIVVLALVFGLGRSERTASTSGTPPAATTGTAPPPSAPAPRTTTGQGGGQ